MTRQLKYTIILMLGVALSAGCATAPDRPDDTISSSRAASRDVPVDEPDGNHYFDFIVAHLEGGRGNLENAIARLHRAVEARPEDVYLKKELIYLYLRNENQAEALNLAQEILEDRPEDAEVLIIAATIRQSMGYPAEAAVLLERAIAGDPDREKVYFVLGDLYSRNDEVEKAAAVYEKMTRQFPDQWDAYFLLGRTYYKQGRFEAAEKNYKKSLSLEPGLLSPRFALVELYKSRPPGYTEITVKEDDTVYSLCRNFYGSCGSGIMEAVAGANPGIEDLNRVGIGQTIRFPHRQHQAGADFSDTIIDLYKSMLADYPDEHRASLELALFYHEIGQEEKAGEILMSLGRASTEDARILQYVNHLYIDRRQYDQAQLIINGMRRGAPDNSTLLYLGGMLFNEKNEYHQALDLFSRVQEDSEYYNHARMQSALLYEEIDQKQKAADLFDELVAEEPDNAALLLYAGAFFERRKDHGKAEELYNRGVEIDPANTELHYRLGVINDKAGKKDEVIRRMKAVLKINPNDANALNYLGYTYAEMGENLDEARDLIEKALALEPDNGYITDSLGWVYYKKGDMEKALEYLEEAVRLLPDDPVLLDHLADAHARNGDPEKALKYYRLSLEHSREKDDSDPQMQKEVQRKIDALTKSDESP